MRQTTHDFLLFRLPDKAQEKYEEEIQLALHLSLKASQQVNINLQVTGTICF